MKLTEKELEIVEIIEKDARLPMEVLAKMICLSVEETEKSFKYLRKIKLLLSISPLLIGRSLKGIQALER